MVAEVGRSPVDFSEGERELISGFNVEFGGGLFVLVFLREYGMVLSFSFLSSCLFIGCRVVGAGGISLLILMLRSTFPRFRYDLFMGLCWLVVLPLALLCICLVLVVKDM